MLHNNSKITSDLLENANNSDNNYDDEDDSTANTTTDYQQHI